MRSMLLHYMHFEILLSEVTHQRLFCDSCGGQNKNYTILRFLHFMINVRKRFERVKMVFPIRGHSYRDMVVINHKTPAETPADWRTHFTEARNNPHPFIVHEVGQNMLLSTDTHFHRLYMCRTGSKSKNWGKSWSPLSILA
ncbi:hypothetical protein PoB_006225400 [Plakobranchus ocellatus]|uniref:Uncharacterized protein n=1 Tax=Plakobranchus ocellatus TaxID=259542 RepID=A0AAV4CV19_9GAST|nr:hypothetical protein PoB_006225400 [Plakobranchus ocellatus]